MITVHRPKLLSLCIAAALVSGSAGAVGLGEIQLASYLGKPLEAEVALNDLGDLGTDQLKIKIGNESDYQALGVEYAYQHSQLKIEPLLRNGRPYVRISSREPITEPYLNFVLNLQWPQGRVVREFTILLDPAPLAVAGAPVPAMKASAKSVAARAEAPSAEVTQSAAEFAVEQTTTPQATGGQSTTEQPAPRRRRVAAPSIDPGTGTYTVRRGDSLWRIAAKLRPQSASLEQTMAAILAANPHAFINGDPERLKEAARLIAPGSEQIAAASGAAPVEAAGTSAPAPIAAAPQLVEENAMLKTQIGELTGNVEGLSRNLEQSEQRLHQVEAQLATLLQQFQQQRATLAALNGAAPAATAPREAAASSVINQVNASELRPTPIARTPWWVHMLYWLGIGGAAMWAVREHFWPQRRLAPAGVGGGESDEAAPNFGNGMARSSAIHRDTAWETPAQTATDQALDLNDLNLNDAPVAEGADAPPALNQVADDPVDVSISAGVFLAFGRYDEAERLLRDALVQNPDRVDLKLQLLDVYIQADQPENFEALALEIERGPITPEIVAELVVLRDSYRPRER